jgi:hypothetical protein
VTDFLALFLNHIYTPRVLIYFLDLGLGVVTHDNAEVTRLSGMGHGAEVGGLWAPSAS